MNAARRAGETVETKRNTLSSSTQANIEIDSPFFSALFLFLSLSIARFEELKGLALPTQVFQSETGGNRQISVFTVP